MRSPKALIPFRRDEKRSDPSISFQSWLELLSSFSYQGVNYTLPGAQQEEIRDYQALIRSAYKSCGIVFACMDVRAKLFSEATFQWRNKSKKLFGTSELARLETPWPGGTTGDLLYRMIQMADLSGNAFVVRRPGGVALLRPDWVDVVGASPNTDGSVWDIDAKVIGYLYHPRGRIGGVDPVALLPGEVAHFAPIPDPEARFSGTTWLWPVIREVMADKAATLHKLQFFQNGATPNMVIKFDSPGLDGSRFQSAVERFKETHEGSANAYKTLFIDSITSVIPVGATPEQIDFKVTQGSGETRIAAAAGVPPVIVGLSEGLQAATYSNYHQAKRRFADQTMRPLWREVCGSLQNILNVPAGCELWYDDRDIPALQDDLQDKAKEMSEKATAANQFVSAGYTRESVIQVLDSGDYTMLVADPNPPSVQMQLTPPGKDTVATPGVEKVLPVPATNGAAT